MSIIVRAYPYQQGDENTGGPEESRLHIDITGKDLLKLKYVLNRALNCAPEFGEDWFALSAKLDNFISQQPDL